MNYNVRTRIIYPELCFQIVGCAFEVHKKIGFGHKEKIYQAALAAKFTENKLLFIQQFPMTVYIDNKKVGLGYADFLVEDRVITELKVGNSFPASNIQQVKYYLQQSDKKLAILINFTPMGVRFKRIVNLEKQTP